jgi:restriction endonuclease S subunit
MQYSIVNLKTVKENSDFRIDAEYYRPDYLEFLNQINLKKKFYLKKILHPTEIKRIYEDSGLQILLAQNVRNNEFDFSNIVYMSEDVKEKLKRNKLQYDDVVLTRSGANFGQSASFKQKQDIYACADVLVIKNTQDFKGGYLSTFLNTKQGRSLLDRGSYGMAQPHIASSYLYNLPIPKFNENFENIVDDLVNKSEKFKDQSKSLYSQAEQLLLSELGLLGWKPKHTLAFVKNYSDTQKAERIDAEYFQPKYEEIIEAVKKYKGGYDELGNLVKINDKNFTPKDNEQYKYIELANISSNGEINGYTENFGNELPSRARRKVQKGDLVISTIEGSLESIALITEDWKNALCSTGFFVVNSNKLNPETLLVLLKTKVGQMQLKKGCKGTILTAIDKNELSKIVLPKIDSKTQEEIKAKITEMYEAKKLSKSLLEIAKRGVEMAIEKDEQEAGKWINGEIEKLGVKIQ